MLAPGQCSQRCIKDSSCPEGFSCIEIASDDRACISKQRLHKADQDLLMEGERLRGTDDQ
jgi:Cys-rich repeat protein